VTTQPILTSPSTEASGMTESLYAVDEAALVMKQAVRMSSNKISKNEKAFPLFLSNLLQSTLQVYNDILKDQVVVSTSAKEIGSLQLQRMVYDEILPYFKKIIIDIRKDITQEFNTKVGEDLETSIHIMKDLTAIQQSSTESFELRVNRLIPKEAPVNWSGQFELYQFKMQLQDYLKNRQIHSQIQGVLSRGRKPISFSVHVLLNHPLGRDYRQDTIGV
jgi:hypothetical protein